jgi:hypothetical protein
MRYSTFVTDKTFGLGRDIDIVLLTAQKICYTLIKRPNITKITLVSGLVMDDLIYHKPVANRYKENIENIL